MKNQTNKGTVIPFCSRKGYRFPNAAEGRYLMGRFVDMMLTAATCAGIVSVLVFLIML